MAMRLLPVQLGEVEVLVEAVAVSGSEPTSRAGDAARQVVDVFDQARDAIVEVATRVAQSVGRLRERVAAPEEVEVEFGLKFSAQGNVIVAGTSAEASLVVRMTYRTSSVGDQA